jgi:hypothetical protein
MNEPVLSTNNRSAHIQKVTSGMNKREKGNENIARACEWVLYWGLSTSAILEYQLGVSHAFANSMEKRGFFRKIPSNGNKFFPTFVYVLTAQGLSIANQNCVHDIDYNSRIGNSITSPDKQLAHNLYIQALTAAALKRQDLDNPVVDFRLENMTGAIPDLGEKRADAVWIRSNAVTMADGTSAREAILFEFEYSSKRGFELEKAIQFTHMAITNRRKIPVSDADPDNFYIVKTALLFTDKLSIANKYKMTSAPQVVIPRAEWNETTGRWNSSGRRESDGSPFRPYPDQYGFAEDFRESYKIVHLRQHGSRLHTFDPKLLESQIVLP